MLIIVTIRFLIWAYRIRQSHIVKNRAIGISGIRFPQVAIGAFRFFFHFLINEVLWIAFENLFSFNEIMNKLISLEFRFLRVFKAFIKIKFVVVVFIIMIAFVFIRVVIIREVTTLINQIKFTLINLTEQVKNTFYCPYSSARSGCEVLYPFSSRFFYPQFPQSFDYFYP